MIHHLHRQGLSIQAISHRTGLDRKTVRKYLQNGLDPPSYGPRKRKPSILEPYCDYLQQRLKAYPELTARRLLRELHELGYPGAYTTVKCYVKKIRPEVEHGYEHRFETPPGEQAQTDFAHFKVVFADEPDQVRVVWLFSMVLRSLCAEAEPGDHGSVSYCSVFAFWRSSQGDPLRSSQNQCDG